MADRWYRIRVGLANAFSEDKTKRLQIRLEIVLALVTIVSLVVGLWFQVRQNGDLDTKVAELNKENAELRTAVGENEGTIDLYRDLNSKLTRKNIELERDQPMLPDDLDAPPLRNNTSSLILAVNGDGIDLNASKDPRFGMSPDRGYDDDELLYQGGGELRIASADTARVVAGETARYATCAIAQGFESVAYTVDVNDIDDRTCFRLGSGRFAAIAVISSSSRRIELAIRVWELP